MRACLLAVLILMGAASAARADREGEPVGRWLTQDHEGVVEILPCGSDLCGRVIGMDAPRNSDGSPVVDTKGQPQCGLRILNRASERQPGMWQGAILNPNDGTTWRCEFWVVGGTLHLRGYVLVPVLGRTQVWTHYTGTVNPDCRMS